MTAKIVTEIKKLQTEYKREYRILVKKRKTYELTNHAFYQDVTAISELFHKQLDAILKG